MAGLTHLTLANHAGMALSAMVRAAQARPRSRVERAKLISDPERDAVLLSVEFMIADKYDMQRDKGEEALTHIRNALGLDAPVRTDSALLEQRRLMRRGERAKKAAPRRVR